MSAKRGNGKSVEAEATPPELTCGLIMPISLLDGCGPEHWQEVKGIVIESVESIKDYEFKTALVSEADEVGVIQKRIIQNVYDSSIVICDVSGKNPNVMFELGMRLAFDKPTVIIKDDRTDYSFDTGVIEHIGYPRDLRFGKMVEFKKKLADKVSSTYRASRDDQDHSPFLKSFGEFHVASLTQTEASPERAMLEMLADVQREVIRMNNRLTVKSFRLEKDDSNHTLASWIKDSAGRSIVFQAGQNSTDPVVGYVATTTVGSPQATITGTTNPSK